MDIFSKRIARARRGDAGVRHCYPTGSSAPKVYYTLPAVVHKAPRVPLETSSIAELTKPYTKALLQFEGLETERLVIRKVRLHDALDMYEYSKDPEVAKHVFWSAHKSVRESYEYIQFLLHKYGKGSPTSYGIILKETGKLIGTIGFMGIKVEHACAEVGYSLKRSMWNKGIITEALQAILCFGFFGLGLHRIDAMHECDNPASAKVLQKAGMQYEGISRQKYYNKGRYVDVCHYGITFTEFIQQYGTKDV